MEALCMKMVLKEKEVEIPLQFYPDSFAYQCQINSLYVQSKQDEPVITRSIGYHIPLSTAMTAGFFDYGVTSYQSWEDPSEQKTKMEPRVRSGVVAGIDKLTFTLKIWPVGKDKSTIFSVHINRFKVVDMPQSVKQTLKRFIEQEAEKLKQRTEYNQGSVINWKPGWQSQSANWMRITYIE
jgi:hypothetical protein